MVSDEVYAAAMAEIERLKKQNSGLTKAAWDVGCEAREARKQRDRLIGEKKVLELSVENRTHTIDALGKANAELIGEKEKLIGICRMIVDAEDNNLITLLEEAVKASRKMLEEIDGTG